MLIPRPSTRANVLAEGALKALVLLVPTLPLVKLPWSKGPLILEVTARIRPHLLRTVAGHFNGNLPPIT